jgi:hypothetical protein
VRGESSLAQAMSDHADSIIMFYWLALRVLTEGIAVLHWRSADTWRDFTQPVRDTREPVYVRPNSDADL